MSDVVGERLKSLKDVVRKWKIKVFVSWSKEIIWTWMKIVRNCFEMIKRTTWENRIRKAEKKARAGAWIRSTENCKGINRKCQKSEIGWFLRL